MKIKHRCWRQTDRQTDRYRPFAVCAAGLNKTLLCCELQESSHGHLVVHWSHWQLDCSIHVAHGLMLFFLVSVTLPHAKLYAQHDIYVDCLCPYMSVRPFSTMRHCARTTKHI